MVYKHLIHDEEPYENACKSQRHDENEAVESSVNRVIESDGVVDGKELVSQAANLNEIDYSSSGGIPSYLWSHGNTVHDHSVSDTAFQFSFVPNFMEFDNQVTTLVRPSDIYSILLECPPRKLVPVGDDHQACIPEWQPNILDNDENSRAKLIMGTCIIPIPNLDTSESDGYCVTDCDCANRDSVECVRQHIGEARDRLKENVGMAAFSEMGFVDMGEYIANKWREHEELAFLEVVLSNPSSMGKNFWHHLPTYFPSRTKHELVSYYFNVFMLRKRADQNRHDTINIDSDNDEWERPDDEDDSANVNTLNQISEKRESIERNVNECLETIDWESKLRSQFY